MYPLVTDDYMIPMIYSQDPYQNPQTYASYNDHNDILWLKQQQKFLEQQQYQQYMEQQQRQQLLEQQILIEHQQMFEQQLAAEQQQQQQQQLNYIVNSNNLNHVQNLYPNSNSYLSSNSSAYKSKSRLTTSIWDDERTICYQVTIQNICVARRQDNDMVNGTKLLNVTGMSRGKRDGILKNEKGRVVVKVGAMHLKGVWIPYSRARDLAIQYNILDQLHPLFADDPSCYLDYPAYYSPLPSVPCVPSMIPSHRFTQSLPSSPQSSSIEFPFSNRLSMPNIY